MTTATAESEEQGSTIRAIPIVSLTTKFSIDRPSILNAFEVKLYDEKKNARVRYLTDADASRLLAACNSDFRLVVLAPMLTGLRKSELQSLTWANVDFAHGSVTVESAYAKTGETGTVPL